MRLRSSSGSFEVACRSTASASLLRTIPQPSSATAISVRPPSRSVISIRRRAGVEAVLHQLLDRRRRPLDHLAGGDAVDDGFRKPADAHQEPARISL